MESIPDISRIVWGKVKGGFSGIMDKFLKVIGKRAKKMVKEYGFLQMEIITKVNGWMVDSMEMESTNIKIVLTTVSSRIV